MSSSVRSLGFLTAGGLDGCFLLGEIGLGLAGGLPFELNSRTIASAFVAPGLRTPTPTNTQTLTPTNTITSTNTPTNTPTPTPTPTDPLTQKILLTVYSDGNNLSIETGFKNYLTSPGARVIWGDGTPIEILQSPNYLLSHTCTDKDPTYYDLEISAPKAILNNLGALYIFGIPNTTTVGLSEVKRLD